ncbi:MAG TPA: 2-amino-4-hydroxy-6-hydroxymethyldihydropteridine diphosphokinase, partial [Ferruginibacter sp.]|nr:2-amino-4-hydroxy-6-hydroxymethyldihydropteridine diphosphokinase [Ferruginibacter sp.]
LISKRIGLIKRKSHLYNTAPWGNINQPDFLNQVLIVSTRLPALETMKAILAIEEKIGRVRTVKNAPRIIDIDILFFDKDIINESILTVPHPALANRMFVLVPLNELSPAFIHPVLKKSIHYLLKNCPDTLGVKKI